MKAKIKATGDIVEVVAYGVDGSYTNYVDRKGDFHTTTLNFYSELELCCCIDWEQRRYEIAKEAVRGVAFNADSFTDVEIKTTVKNALRLADVLIKELQNGVKK